MPVGMEVDLGPGDLVLDRDPASSLQKGHSPQLLVHNGCGQTAGWIKMPLSRDIGPRPRQHRVRWAPSSSTKKGAQQPPTFQTMSIVAKWSSISPTAKLLLHKANLKATLHTFNLLHIIIKAIRTFTEWSVS